MRAHRRKVGFMLHIFVNVARNKLIDIPFEEKQHRKGKRKHRELPPLKYTSHGFPFRRQVNYYHHLVHFKLFNKLETKRRKK